MKQYIDDSKPIYLQIAEKIEDDILNISLAEGDSVPSTNQFAQHFQINPATAAKGINKLVEEGILFKKRGIGMFVQKRARQVIMQKRSESFYNEYIIPLLREAKKLNLDQKTIIALIEKAESEENHG